MVIVFFITKLFLNDYFKLRTFVNHEVVGYLRRGGNRRAKNNPVSVCKVTALFCSHQIFERVSSLVKILTIVHLILPKLAFASVGQWMGVWRIFDARFSALLAPSCAPLRGRWHGVTNVAGSSSHFLGGGTVVGHFLGNDYVFCCKGRGGGVRRVNSNNPRYRLFTSIGCDKRILLTYTEM